ncbi:hypothetical protein HanRHA438_Chr08g0365411 [Helianthus annuus]|nr:hypothetical protein HanRHA438_Chr08g0365411 [Helianthus annuus]
MTNLNWILPNLSLVMPSRFNHGFDIGAIRGTEHKCVSVSSYKRLDQPSP